MEKKKRREKGTGNIYQRKNGSWVGRLTSGVRPDGKPNTMYFSGKTAGEVKHKILEFNRSGLRVNANKVTVEEYLVTWLVESKRDTLSDSEYDDLKKIVESYILPNIGSMKIFELGSEDLQKMLLKLRNEGCSFSIVKDVYCCLNEVMIYACYDKVVSVNPMLSVKMLHQDFFGID